MADTENVLSQADALMYRHRSFVARAPATEDCLPPDPSADLDADIPVLTEVVAESAMAPPTVADLLDTLQYEIENELSEWLVDALPAAVANASQHIITELDTKARNSLLPRLKEIIKARRDKTTGDQSL